ncbi:MAG: dependent oxidoreductase, partial [Herbinix sp.]|nr:dependent oxidoreductase [Herbinix sp.]
MKKYEFVVVGGGMSGICAAIAAAREGIETALIHNRPVLGGNASSEIRMHICGASCHDAKENSRESGIIEELLLENKRRNPLHSYPIFDSILWEKVRFQKNLTLYLNSHMTKVITEGNRIQSILVEQITTERSFELFGDLFMDATGDGTLGFLAGAEFMTGTEARDTFGEEHAPVKGSPYVMGSTLMFKAKKMEQKVPFIKPFWANTYTEEDLALRDHSNINSGYWWIEIGGVTEDTIKDGELIRDRLLKAVYGIWDHIKNSGKHDADYLDLEWIGFLPCKRESRRLVGDYVLKEDDCLSERRFEDAVAYGGWPIDVHTPGGLEANHEEPTVYLRMMDVFTIPYRCLYSKNIDNLFLGGRIISCSHMAFASTRVMGTCAVVG